jgi:hypothetical protein
MPWTGRDGRRVLRGRSRTVGLGGTTDRSFCELFGLEWWATILVNRNILTVGSNH